MTKLVVLFCLASVCVLEGCRKPAGDVGAEQPTAAQVLDPRPQIYDAFNSVKSYRKSLDMETNRGHQLIEAQTSCPGRSHYRISLNGTVHSERYFIEDTDKYLQRGEWVVNVRPPGFHWKIAPGCPGDYENGFGLFGGGGENDVVSSLDYLTLSRFGPKRDSLKFHKADQEDVDGVPCQIWQASFTNMLNEDYEYQLFVGIADNLPRRIVVNYPGVKIALRYWDWNNPDISIIGP